MNNIAVLIPTIFRPEGLERVINSLSQDNVDIYVAREFDDFTAYNICAKHNIKSIICVKPNRGPAYAWNVALQRAEGQSKYYAYFLGSDDIVFEHGWLEESLIVLDKQLHRSGLVGVNDGTGKFERAGFATQYLMTRDFIVKENGGVAACPHYLADFVDVESCERAKRANKFAYASKAIVRHLWRQVDDIAYQRADGRRVRMRELYLQRLSKNFPNDFEVIIK
jgi:GT2 family glycosyltransferase